jgi:hypothetical protein
LQQHIQLLLRVCARPQKNNNLWLVMTGAQANAGRRDGKGGFLTQLTIPNGPMPASAIKRTNNGTPEAFESSKLARAYGNLLVGISD